jgi:hypothetical protein
LHCAIWASLQIRVTLVNKTPKDGIRSTIWTCKNGAGEFDAKDGMMWALIVMLLVMWLCVLLTLSFAMSGS